MILLQTIGKGEGVVHLILLKNIQPAIQQDFPAVVGEDRASVDGAAGVKFPIAQIICLHLTLVSQLQQLLIQPIPCDVDAFCVLGDKVAGERRQLKREKGWCIQEQGQGGLAFGRGL